MQPVVTIAPVPVPQNTQPIPSTVTQYKYQNPLEKLLQSAGVPANRSLQASNKDPCQGSGIILRSFFPRRMIYLHKKFDHVVVNE